MYHVRVLGVELVLRSPCPGENICIGKSVERDRQGCDVCSVSKYIGGESSSIQKVFNITAARQQQPRSMKTPLIPSEHPVGKPLYPIPTTRFLESTMQAPT